IELDFLNDGLWMRSDSVDLGGVKASKLAAAIPDYSKEKLLIDTSTPMGRFFFHVMGALAEMERELIVERTRAGLEAARAKGR
ncbi:recombinase family protein, partial [Salmonella enterica subsp. enterica serovar Virginia]|nr:recombinase family protein [Salmonella enterica subsp. enterica serovar Virginia]